MPEAVHSGHLALVGPDGAVLAALGDPETVTIVRSTAKPFQASACLELLDLSATVPTPPEIAVACASHRAEQVQLDAVQRLLRRSATPPDDLTCPAAVGEHDPAATALPLRHNCSGKHALFALAGQRQGTAGARLLEADGPLQRPVLAVLEDAFGAAAAVTVDGCGAPVVAVPLVAVARAYAALATESRWQRAREAMLARPDLVGGQGRLETALLGLGLVAKPGAEGIFAVGWTGRDGGPRGLAVRTTDGARRATLATVAAVLGDLELVPPGTWTPPRVLGGGRPVGAVAPSEEVRAVGASAPAAR